MDRRLNIKTHSDWHPFTSLKADLPFARCLHRFSLTNGVVDFSMRQRGAAAASLRKAARVVYSVETETFVKIRFVTPFRRTTRASRRRVPSRVVPREKRTQSVSG